MSELTIGRWMDDLEFALRKLRLDVEAIAEQTAELKAKLIMHESEAGDGGNANEKLINTKLVNGANHD